MRKKVDIAVVGVSCYYPGAYDIKSFWQNVLSKRQQFRDIPDCRLPLSEYWNKDKSNPDTTYGRKAALIDNFDFDWQKRKIPKITFESSDIVHWLALETALEAIKDANIDLDKIQKDNVGVVVGNSLTGEFTRSEFMRLRWPYINKVLKATAQKFGWDSGGVKLFSYEMEALYKSLFTPINEDSLAGGLSNTIAGRICNFCDFHGGGYVVDGACSSSLLSVITAASALANDEMDVALAGGVDISLDGFELIGFSKAGALTDKEMKVYDENRSGFIPGEGCGFVVLKRLEDAKKNGDRIYATIKGWGISSDGSGGITAPSAKGQSMAIIRALQKANMSPGEINFIEGHGTGTLVGDTTELNAINLAFEHFNVKKGRNCAVTSAKSIIGHTKAAAGIAAFIKTVIALNQRVIPPTAGITNLHPLFKTDNFPLYPAIKAKKYLPKDTLNAGVSAMGFGGINTHVILSSAGVKDDKFNGDFSEEQLSVSNQDSEIIAFSALNQDDLIEQLEEIRQYALEIATSELADFAKYMADKIDFKQPLKAAFIVKTTDELYQKISAIQDYLTVNIISENLVYQDAKLAFFIGINISVPKIAFLFPGQGSQKINSASFLIERFPWAQKIKDQLDQIDGRNISDKIYPQIEQLITDSDIKNYSDNLSKSQISQPAIILSSILWLHFLKKLGIKAKAVGGHSLGELAALYEAGAYDLESLLKITSLRGNVMGNVKSKGKMVSLTCDASKAKELIKNIDGLVIANFNSPKQTVISGDSEAIDNLVDLTNRLDIHNYVLPVSNAFHSPFMQEAADYFKSKLVVDKIFVPNDENTMFFSSLFGKKIDHEIDIKNHLAFQVTSPVKFVDMINDMSSEVDYMIEVGPGNVLSNLVAKITDDNIQSFAVEKIVNDLSDLNLLLADLYVRNVELNWDELYQNRLIHPFINPINRKFIVNPIERPLVIQEDEIINYQSNNSVNFMQKNKEIVMEIDMGGNQATKFSFDLMQKNKEATKENAKEINIGENQAIKFSFDVNNRDILKAQIQSSQNPYNVEQLLIDTVFEITGFSKSSISLNHKVLSDLNLDSIKSATLITRIARKLNINQSSINASRFANATLQEIKDMLESKIQDQPQNKDVERQTPEQKNNSSWFRYFAIRNFEESIDPKYDFDKLINHQTLILGWDFDDWQKDFLAQFDELRLKAKYINVIHGDDLSKIRNSHIILVIPQQGDLYKHSDIERRLMILAKLNNLDFDSLLSLNVIHFGSEISSLFASIHHEYPSLKINLIDIDENYDKKKLIAIISDGLNNANNFDSACYSERTKYISCPVVYAEEKFIPRNIEWTSKDVILVTGGAKGITNECIFDWSVSNKIKARLVLFGRSSASDVEFKKVIKKFQDSGINCYYYSCDITDSNAVKKTIDLIKNNLGNITGLVHGAGFNKPRLFKDVSNDEALLEISPKVLGLLNILDLIDLRNLKIITAISSIIGYTGMPGNAWYAWSNKMMERIMFRCRRQNPNLQTCVIAYSLWDEIGMGFNMGSLEYLASKGINTISKNDGAKSFSKLMDNSLGLDSYIVTSKLGNLDSWNPPIPQKPNANRFLEKILYFEPLVELICQCHLTMNKDLYLKDHNFQGSILLPTVFGLEAMAEAVAYTIGVQKFNFPIEIVNIDLNNPIVVDEKQGLKIQIKVLVESKNRILAMISTEESNYTIDHFKAEFRLSDTNLNNVLAFSVNDQPLTLNPKKDLYGSLLFQGPMFHKMDKIYKLSEDEIVYDVVDDSNHRVFNDALSQSLILGNPFMRDVLLQSMQVCIPDQKLLPIRIERILINSTSNSKFLARTLVIKKDESRNRKSFVTVIDDKGNILEYLDGYIVTATSELFKAGSKIQDIINPSKYDEQFLNKQLEEFAVLHGIKVPIIRLEYIEDLLKFGQDQRRDKEMPLFKSVVRQILLQNNLSVNEGDFEIKWNNLNQPNVQLLNGLNIKDPYISLSHDGRLCVCVAENYPIGCDIESVINRDYQEWEDLILNHKKIWNEISNFYGIDVAGTIIWTIIESIIKSNIFDGAYNLSLLVNDKNNLLFLASDINNKQIFILSTIFDAFHPPKRVFSCIVSKKELVPTQILTSIPMANNSFANMASGEFNYKKRGAFGEEIYVHRFRTTFKDANNVGKTIHHPTFAVWMGKLRELSLSHLASDLIPDMMSGKWGMVTNNSYIKIINDNVKALDLVEGHFWINKVYGKFKSTVDLAFEWFKVEDNGVLSPIAYTFLPTTWVKIIDTNVVEVYPFPEYFQKWIDDVVLKNNDKDYLEEIKNYQARYDIGKLLYKNDNFLDKKKVLCKSSFYTSLEESNLVGNIYYSNYYKWQAKVFDQFIHGIDPEFYLSNTNSRKFICLDSEVNHLQEAGPFDTIEVRLYVDALYEMGFDLVCEFYSVRNNVKLAYGRQRMVLAENRDGTYLPCKMIDYIIDNLGNNSISKFNNYFGSSASGI